MSVQYSVCFFFFDLVSVPWIKSTHIKPPSRRVLQHTSLCNNMALICSSSRCGSILSALTFSLSMYSLSYTYTSLKSVFLSILFLSLYTCNRSYNACSCTSHFLRPTTNTQNVRMSSHPGSFCCCLMLIRESRSTDTTVS